MRNMRNDVLEPPVNDVPGGSARSTSRVRLALASLIVVCVVSRIATTIYYIEDIDSLHFALAMIEFDVAHLQPHFPGYIVFVSLAGALTSIAGSFAVGFALVGGIATCLLVVGMLALLRWELVSLRGVMLAVLLVGNGMLWLYGNRYMPDLLGVALLVWCMRDLMEVSGAIRVRGAFLAALLAGTRLSYMPFLVPFAIAALSWRTHRIAAAAAFAFGIVLWSIPLVASTGWSELIDIASNQTSGHFDEFGGTIRTEPDLLLRIARMLEGVWSDALGGYWRGRGALTAIAGGSAAVAIAFGISRIPSRRSDRRLRLVSAGICCYLVWILLFQNVVHHSRHLLPLVPFALALAAIGLNRLARARYLGIALAAVTIGASTLVGARLALQHRKPSAIAQTSIHLQRPSPPLTVISTGLVNYYLASTGVRARFVDVDSNDVAAIVRATPSGHSIVSVGDYRASVGLPAVRRHRFYHNPHVNRIWPVVELYAYTDVAASSR